MPRKDIYIRIWSILRTFYFLEKKRTENADIKFNGVLSRWNMGDDSQELTFIEQELINTKPEVLLKDVDTYSKDLRGELSDISLSVLYKDIKDIVLSDGDIVDIERKCLSVVEDNWREKLVDIDSLVHKMCNKDVFCPENCLVALGFLFLATMKADGHIDKREIKKLRDNLKVWNNENARIIHAVVNMAEMAIESNDILGIFDEEEPLTLNTKTSITNCAKFLKNTEYVGLRRIMYEQIMGIIKADNIVHDNEKWIRNELRNIWNDLEG